MNMKLGKGYLWNNFPEKERGQPMIWLNSFTQCEYSDNRAY